MYWGMNRLCAANEWWRFRHALIYKHGQSLLHVPGYIPSLSIVVNCRHFGCMRDLIASYLHLTRWRKRNCWILKKKGKITLHCGLFLLDSVSLYRIYYWFECENVGALCRLYVDFSSDLLKMREAHYAEVNMKTEGLWKWIYYQRKNKNKT